MKRDREQIAIDAINADIALSDQLSIKRLTDLLIGCPDVGEFVASFDSLSASAGWAEQVIKRALEVVGTLQVNSEKVLRQSPLSLSQFKDYLRRLFIDIVALDDSEPDLANFVSNARSVLLKFDFVQRLHEILITPAPALDPDLIARAVKAIYDCHSESTGGQQLVFDIGDALVMAATLAGETLAAMAEASLCRGFSPGSLDAQALSTRVSAVIDALQEPEKPDTIDDDDDERDDV